MILTLFRSAALLTRELCEFLIPGKIIPPSYDWFFITSNVVAVPKSTIMQFLNLCSITDIAFASLSAPILLISYLIAPRIKIPLIMLNTYFLIMGMG